MHVRTFRLLACAVALSWIIPQVATATPVSKVQSAYATHAAVNGASLLANGSFDAAGASWQAPWTLQLTSTGQASMSQDTSTAADGPASAAVNITRVNSKQLWYVALIQGNLGLVAGTTYTLSFWAKSTHSTWIGAGMQQAVSPGQWRAYRSYLLSTSWQPLTLSFTAPVTESPVNLQFDLGQSIGTVWIDGVSLTDPVAVPSATVAPSATATIAPPTSTATNTPVAPTSTAVPPTVTGTSTIAPPTATATKTAVPPTASATKTAVPPTASATKTTVPPTASATKTAVPPTASATKTAVPPTASATKTAVPPTATATKTAVPTSTPAGTTNPQPVGQTGTWNVAFDDEFSTSSLDLTKWQPNWLGGSNTAITPPANSSETECYDPKQVSVGSGELDLQAIASSCTTSDGTTRPYRSGLIESNGKYNFTYGYAEARMWTPAGTGMWPAFWSDGQNWPQDGEIDTLEADGTNMGSYHYHYPGGGPGGDVSVPGAISGWHTYATDWEPGVIKWYYDGNLVWTLTNADLVSGNTITASPQYLILNLASESTNSPMPATLRVDYVRVWKKG